MELIQETFSLVGVVLLGVQLVCLCSKKVWVRLLPLIIVAAMAVLCIVLYALSGFTNWWWLLFLPLIFDRAVTLGICWLIYGVFYAIEKATK